MDINENLKFYFQYHHYQLTKGEQKIVDYLLRNWNANTNASSIASNTGLSNSLVTKVFKKFGFQSAREFYKIKESSLEECFKHLISVNQKNYQATILKNNIKRIIKFAASLDNYKQIFLYGVGHSGIAATNFQSRIRRIGYNATALNGRNSLVENAGLLKDNALVILISNSGETAAIKNVAHFCHKNKIDFVLLTSNIYSSIADYCNEIYLFHTERNSFFIETLGTEEPAIQLLNVIYYYLLNKNYRKAIHNYTFSETFTDYY